MVDSRVDRMEAMADSPADKVEDFLPVINAIDFNALSAMALQLRSSADPNPGLTCTACTEPLIGTYNAAFVLSFSDNKKWVARVPGRCISKWDSKWAASMMADARLRELIRCNTKVPVPRIFAIETDCNNAVGVPFTMEAFAGGSSLSEVWPTAKESLRRTIIRNLATIMASFHSLRYDRVGVPRLTRTGDVEEFSAMLDYDMEPAKLMQQDEIWPDLITSGPYASVRAQLMDGLGGSPTAKSDPRNTAWDLGLHMITRLAIESLPNSFETDGYFLCHPDFDAQNIYVDDAGDITALIDWEGTHTSCAALGFVAYPRFLMRDWLPGVYEWGRAFPHNPASDTPEQLFHYRQIYAEVMQKELQKAGVGRLAEATRVSPVLFAIEDSIVDKITGVQDILQLLNWAIPTGDPFFIDEFGEILMEGSGTERCDQLRKAFAAMWHEEGQPWIFGDRTKDVLGYRTEHALSLRRRYQPGE